MLKLAPNRHEVNLIKQAVAANPKISAKELAERMNIEVKSVSNWVRNFKGEAKPVKEPVKEPAKVPNKPAVTSAGKKE